LLSQTLWWFGLSRDEQYTRAKLERRHCRWMAKSDRQWEDELGLGRSCVHRALYYLVMERKFLVRGRWVVDRRRDRNQSTTHVRPNVSVLEKVLLATRTLDKAIDFASRRLAKS